MNRLEGRNAVLEALKHGVPIDKILIRRGEFTGTLRLIAAKAREAGVPVSETDARKLDEMSQSRNHQGVVAICPVKEYADVSDILRIAADKNEEPFIIILDSVTDTYNLGAVIRTAEACGAHGVIIPKRRSATLTGMVSKSSAGAAEYIPVARVSNIVNTIESLKKQNIWIVAADMSGTDLYETEIGGAVALVVGGEGAGVARLIKEKSDFIVKIPMFGKIPSLNSSVAAGVIMYEIVRRRARR